MREIFDPRFQAGTLVFRHRAHLGIGRRIRQQGVDVGQFAAGGAICLHRLDHRIEFGQLPGDADAVVGADLAEQFGLQRRMARQQDIEFGFGKLGHGNRS